MVAFKVLDRVIVLTVEIFKEELEHIVLLQLCYKVNILPNHDGEKLEAIQRHRLLVIEDELDVREKFCGNDLVD